ncbi:MAG: SusC/RagA family TonB-linked outer membrane protein, partial [Marinifilum sp.]|jgi:TonB-linked SusC/RagA family outer membrane protein|nr:SusC/RagA family TonB-linked outer membrane protein [Marinifilum sp.]
LDIEQERAVLVFSFVGMLSQERNYTGQLLINVELSPDTEGLDEVVVTGYQTIAKERATGSFAIVNKSKIQNRISTNINSRLEGLVAGMQVDEDGNFTIRGISTLNANKKPLIVLDGFILERDLSTINPDDIEAIHVLKDAAAASIYGVRAANGVIVITTKTGQNKKLKITFGTDFSIIEKPRLEKAGYASSEDVVNMELEAFQKGWYIEPSILNNHRPISKVASMIFASEGYKNRFQNGEKENPYDYLNSDEKEQIENLKKQDGIEQYKKYFIQESVKKTYNLSMFGGSNKHDYFVSCRYDDNKGSLVRNNDSRLILNSKQGWRLSDKIRVTCNINYNYSKFSTPKTLHDNVFKPNPMYAYGNFLNEKGEYNSFPKTLFQSAKDEAVGSGHYLNWNYNPLQDLRNTSDINTTNTISVNGTFDYNVNDKLNVNVRASHVNSNITNVTHYKRDSYLVRNTYNYYTTINEDTKIPIHSFPYGEIKEDLITGFNSDMISGLVNYDTQKDKHSFSMLGGLEYRQVESKSSMNTHIGYDSKSLTEQTADFNLIQKELIPRYKNLRLSDVFQLSNINKHLEDRFFSVFTNLRYNFDEKYDLTASGRIDDSNLFGADISYRILPLWSLGLGWTISNESFFKTEFIDYLKIKGSFGYSGNIDRSTSPFIKANLYSDVHSGRMAAEIENPGNPNLKWEKTRTINASVDFRIFHAIFGSLQYYEKKSDDLLGDKVVNPLLGYTTVKANVAKVLNRGIELELNSQLYNSRNWDININANFFYNKNKVLAVHNDIDRFDDVFTTDYYSKNKPINSAFTYKWAGLSEDGKPQVYNKEGEKVSSLSQDLFNIQALKYVGTTQAPYHASLMPVVRFKNLTVNLLFVGKFGHIFKLSPIVFNDLELDGNMISKEIRKRWKKPGDEKITDVPGLGKTQYDINMDYFNYSDIRIRPADFISLREVGISYEVPKLLLFSDVTIKFQARNVFMWTKNKENINPENTSFFGNTFSYPSQRSVSLGIRFNF